MRLDHRCHQQVVGAGMTAFEARAPFVTNLIAAAEQNRSRMIAAFEGREPNFDIAGARKFIVYCGEELEGLGRNAEAASRDELHFEVAREVRPVGSTFDRDVVPDRALDPDSNRAPEGRLDVIERPRQIEAPLREAIYVLPPLRSRCATDFDRGGRIGAASARNSSLRASASTASGSAQSENGSAISRVENNPFERAKIAAARNSPARCNVATSKLIP